VTLLIIVYNLILFTFLEMAVQGQEQRLLTSYDVYKNYAGFAGNSLSIIIAPIAVNYWFKDRYFGTQAIVGSVFDYHLTTLVTIPFLMMIGPD
jgi:Cu/Ag efflux pump CusA